MLLTAMNCGCNEWGLNNIVKGIGRPPAEMLSVTRLSGTTEVIMKSTLEDCRESNSQKRDTIRADVCLHDQEKQKKRFDKTRGKPRYFVLGDLLRVERTVCPGKSKKLMPKYYGPYKIVCVFDNDVVDDTPLRQTKR